MTRSPDEEDPPAQVQRPYPKPATGLLSTGRRNLVCTTAKDNGGKRAPLNTPYRDPAKTGSPKSFSLAASCIQANPVSQRVISLSSPHATEHEGKLYLSYSNNGGRHRNENTADRAGIAINSLRMNK
jgi:hypothetical protein